MDYAKYLDPAERREFIEQELRRQAARHFELSAGSFTHDVAPEIAATAKRITELEAQLEQIPEPTIEELAQQEVERQAQQAKLDKRIQELREAHPDIDTSEEE